MLPNDDIRSHGKLASRERGRVQCNYCHKLMYSGFKRLKLHLGGVPGEVAACTKVPENVKKLYHHEKFKRISIREVHLLDPGRTLPSKRICSQRLNSFEQIRNGFESLVELTGINLTTIRESMSSKKDSKLEHGIYYPDLIGTAPDVELKEMQDYVKGIKHSWSTTGCSILVDTWSDEQGRELVIFLADCSEGPVYLRSSVVSSYDSLGIDAFQMMIDKVMEDVGSQNVIQIVACSTAGWLGAMEQRFMDICKTGFWNVSASHCIDLMLEKMAQMDSIKPVMEMAGTLVKFMSTCSFGLQDPSCEGKSAATPFMALATIVDKRETLEEVVDSFEWEESVWTSTEEGKRVYELVKNSSFWRGAKMVLKASLPLVHLQSIIHGADGAFIGYIYETMDQVKEAIKIGFRNSTSRYIQFWEVIDEMWNNHLHSPLHAAGYYLNPNLFYSGNFFLDREVAFGLLCCIVRLVRDKHIQDLICEQLCKYRFTQGDFEVGSSDEFRDKPPIEWWLEYGRECPELQTFAIRILSQTCDGHSRYGLNRDLAQKLLASEIYGVDQQEQDKLQDLIFLRYNQQLRYFKKNIAWE